MKVHYFVIVADGLDPDADETYNAFYEHGCNDACISWADGTFELDFHREALSFDLALSSACRDVRKAGATIIRIEPALEGRSVAGPISATAD